MVLSREPFSGDFRMSRLLPVPLRFAPWFEQPEPDEADTARRIAAALAGHAEGDAPLRRLHARTHGLLRGELQVLENLAEPLAQGLFAEPATYETVVRLSSHAAEGDDGATAPRGMAVKVLGVSGERLPGSENDLTQDFVLVNAPAASAGGEHPLPAGLDAADGGRTTAASTWGLAAMMRAGGAVMGAVGGGVLASALGTAGAGHVLGETFYSQAPLLYGPYIAKIAIAPVSPELIALTGTRLSVAGRPDALREEVVAFFREQGGEWDVLVQLCTDLATMPIEDASVRWPEEASPYLRVARLRIPAQEAWSPQRAETVDAGLSFSPWHGLAAHRPLGRVMRLRRETYAAVAAARARRIGRALAEPRSFDDLPGFAHVAPVSQWVGAPAP
ncbi:Catalase [Rhodovulum sp. PH10]|nr:Catalase [Rhodovulum sp. PH10]